MIDRVEYSFDEYQASMLRTANPNLDWNETVNNCLLGLIGELGEVVEQLAGNSEILVQFIELAKTAEALKKLKYHGNLNFLNENQQESGNYTSFSLKLENSSLAKELGDTLYYLTWLVDTCGLELSGVAQTNVEKLRKRYGNGFSVEKSLNREA